MKKLFYASLAALLTFYSCQQTKESSEESGKDEKMESTPRAELMPMWETDSTLTTAESVLFDSSRNMLYVSCINGVPPTAQDNDGFIALVNPANGKIEDLLWVTDIDAPKGMALYGDLLYVTNIDEVVEISVNDAVIINRYAVDSAEFLNDMVLGEDGKIYFSDSNTGKIHVMEGGEISTWMDLGEGVGPNGLYIKDQVMMVAGYSSGKLHAIDMTSREVSTVTDSIGAGDGVQVYNDAVLVSNWNGEIYTVFDDNSRELVLDTKENANAADILVLQDKSIVYVPTFFNNTVAAYEVKINKPL